MAGSASASSWLGQATRTIWQPAAVSSAICCSVALMSVVGVVVIDWTETGASPPTSTPPTSIWRETRRVASGLGGVSGMPRETVMCPVSPPARTADGSPGYCRVIGFTMSAASVSRVSPPNSMITRYVAGSSLL